jgi:hypothetical protein
MAESDARAVVSPSNISRRQRGGGLPGKPERLRNRLQREGLGEAMRGGIREEGLHPGVRALTGAVRGPFNSSDRAPILVLRLAPASFLVTPVSGPLAMVEARLLDDEEGSKGIGEGQTSYAAMLESQNAGGRSIEERGPSRSS